MPLQLKNTAITLSRRMKRNLVPGLTAVLQPALPFSSTPIYAEMVAAGGLFSTANDLPRFLAVEIGYERSPFAPAMTAMLTTRRPMTRPEESQALGWVMVGTKDDLLILHEGGTGGYASALAWDPQNRTGVVVLSNQVASVGDIARHLLRPKFPLSKPTAEKRTEIALDSLLLDQYVGQYELRGGGVLHLGREVDFLTMQLAGLPKLRLRAESQRESFVAEFPVRVTVQTDSERHVYGLLIDPGRGKPAVPALRRSPAR